METTLALVRFSPAWCIFMLGLLSISLALLGLSFIAGEGLAIRFLATEVLCS